MSKVDHNSSQRAVTLTKSGIIASRLLLFLALVVITYLATAEINDLIAGDINDKLGHLLAFYLLAILTDLSFPERTFDFTKWMPLFLYGLVIEIIQYHLPSRMFSLLDLTADAIGLSIYWCSIPILIRLSFLKSHLH